ncbi:MAG: efflux RND transporter permease subunit [Burkholderiales bacterium]|nr:efflux RND transporter permease subunit [Burkholderiales bacterium]
MMAKLIRWSIANRFLVLLATLMMTAWGIWSLSRTPLDAIPDLSDVQVIIRTSYPGQAPQIVENQITYPLTTTMLSVPGAKTVRGYSFFGDSFVYVLFEDSTDMYWARSRVLEYLNQVQSRLPPQAKASLGPDATGVGWVYEYALVDRSGKMDLSQLRAFQSGYLKSLDDFRKIPLMTTDAGVSVRLGDVARIQIGPEMRRGIADLNGEGEVAGGVIVMRSGKNALETIDAVKAKLEKLKASLPPGVEVVTTYDRSNLINRAVKNLQEKLVEEFIVVAIVCAIFLFHLRSALVAIVTLPIGILIAFIVMHYQGVNANIMSLGGIAIAVGAMVDAAVVMIENAHKHIEAWNHANPDKKLQGETHWRVIGDAAAEVGPALFFSLLIIVLSFIPVFTLEAQEGRLFSPLAFTKTYAMAAAAGLAVTLIPVLMGYLIRGKIPDEQKNPLNRLLIALYRPLLDVVLRFPKLTLVLAAIVAILTVWPLARLGGEFMPPLDEGDLLYMPSALPGIGAGKVSELLQQTDRLIKTVPEVKSVFGKAGRAESATDPAPLEMFETTIQFKPRDQWRPGMTTDKLVEELDRIVKVPGLSNIWVPPIRNRIDMLATGIKSPVGVKVAGTDLKEIDRITGDIERVIKNVPGVSSALAERLNGGRYIDVDINRDAAARYGLNISDVQSIVSAAIGGDNIGETIEGLQRFPINVRYPREVRDSVEKLRQLPVLTERGAQIRLGDVAEIRINDGPPMLKSENARLSGWVYVDIRDRDLSSAVHEMQEVVAREVKLPPGYSIAWSGQFEYLERATAKLKVVVPATLLIIFVLLYMTFKRVDEAALIMATLPFALAGGIWLLWALGHNLSVASGVGFIALAGVSAEFGVIMLLYLKHAWDDRLKTGKASEQDLLDAIREGAVLRVRPKAMTVAVIIAGLVPIMLGAGTGSEVMKRIAAPMVGGMITARLLCQRCICCCADGNCVD